MVGWHMFEAVVPPSLPPVLSPKIPLRVWVDLCAIYFLIFDKQQPAGTLTLSSSSFFLPFSAPRFFSLSLLSFPSFFAHSKVGWHMFIAVVPPPLPPVPWPRILLPWEPYYCATIFLFLTINYQQKHPDIIFLPPFSLSPSTVWRGGTRKRQRFRHLK